MAGTEDFSVTYPKPVSDLGGSHPFSSYEKMATRFLRVRGDIGTTPTKSYLSSISVPSPFVPSPLGGKKALTEPRNLEGMGEFVLDPMQNFRSEKLDLEGYKYGSRIAAPQKDPGSTANIRRKGLSAYKRLKAGKNPNQPPKQRKKTY